MHTPCSNTHAGDAIKEDDVIAQIETDKVTIDVKYTAKAPGVLTALMVASGDVVQVGGKCVCGGGVVLRFRYTAPPFLPMGPSLAA